MLIGKMGGISASRRRRPPGLKMYLKFDLIGEPNLYKNEMDNQIGFRDTGNSTNVNLTQISSNESPFNNGRSLQLMRNTEVWEQTTMFIVFKKLNGFTVNQIKTVSFWMKSHKNIYGIGLFNINFNYGTGAIGSAPWEFITISHNRILFHSGESIGNINYESSYIDSQWVFYTITIEGALVKLYTNGVLRGQTTLSKAFSSYEIGNVSFYYQSGPVDAHLSSILLDNFCLFDRIIDPTPPTKDY